MSSKKEKKYLMPTFGVVRCFSFFVFFGGVWLSVNLSILIDCVEWEPMRVGAHAFWDVFFCVLCVCVKIWRLLRVEITTSHQSCHASIRRKTNVCVCSVGGHSPRLHHGASVTREDAR